MARTEQDGIYYDEHERPGDAFGMLFLRAEQDATAAEVGAVLHDLWSLWQRLRAGDVPDLPGHPVASGSLTVLVGYGPKVFGLADAARTTPENLGDSFRFRSPLPSGGGPLLRGGGLRYGAAVTSNLATEEVAVQLVAETELAVHRAVVETWRLLLRHVDAATGTSPLQIAAFYRGFQRDDGRSWLGFHDGVSNLSAGRERAEVLRIKPENAPAPADAWTIGGSYLAFLRLAVDLTAWDAIDVPGQEAFVGRSRLTGAPLADVDGELLVPATGCPVPGTRTVLDPGNERFHEPAAVAHPRLRASHVQRANQHSRPGVHPNSLRIFRQGYEFLDVVNGAPTPGLNFVSFQDTPQRLTRMLTQQSWLGDTNFGGDEGTSPEIISVLAGGLYLAPPRREDGGLPGSEIFG